MTYKLVNKLCLEILPSKFQEGPPCFRADEMGSEKTFDNIAFTLMNILRKRFSLARTIYFKLMLSDTSNLKEMLIMIARIQLLSNPIWFALIVIRGMVLDSIDLPRSRAFFALRVTSLWFQLLHFLPLKAATQ